MSALYQFKRFSRNIRCSILGHDYTLLKKYDNNVQKLICKRCHKIFGINHSVRAVVEWDADLEDCMKLCYPNK